MVGCWKHGALAFLMLPTTAFIPIVVLIDPDDPRSRLIDGVQDATNPTLSLNGRLRVTWSPWPMLQVDGVWLSNLPGDGRPTWRAERLDAMRLRLVGIEQPDRLG